MENTTYKPMVQGTAMGTKMAVVFANIFMASVETEILNQSALKPLIWERYIDDIFSPCTLNMWRGDSAVHCASKQTPPHN